MLHDRRSDTPVMRRTFLLGAAGAAVAALAACAADSSGAPSPAATTAAPPTAVETPPSSETTASTPDGPDVEAVIAKYEGRVPQQWGMEFAGIVTTGAQAGAAHPESIFLTLDACGGPYGSGYDERLISALVDEQVPATLFLNLQWVEANPGIAASLAANPLFEIANHGSEHRPLSVTGREAYGIAGTANVREAAMEVWENHVALTELTGVAPRWFRPGTAHLDDVGLDIANDLGERVLGFTVNGDGGATLSAAGVEAEASAAGPGDVIIAHMNQPESGTAEGLIAAIRAIRDRGGEFGLL